jgi:mRNA interferase MazF
MTRDRVVLVPFPFDDLSGTKVRPAVCLTDPIGPERHVVLAFVTSRIPSDLLETDLVIPADHPDFASCGLRVSSTVRLHRLMTVSTRLILREMGTLSRSLQQQLRAKVSRLFAEQR